MCKRLKMYADVIIYPTWAYYLRAIIEKFSFFLVVQIYLFYCFFPSPDGPYILCGLTTQQTMPSMETRLTITEVTGLTPRRHMMSCLADLCLYQPSEPLLQLALLHFDLLIKLVSEKENFKIITVRDCVIIVY